MTTALLIKVITHVCLIGDSLALFQARPKHKLTLTLLQLHATVLILMRKMLRYKDTQKGTCGTRNLSQANLHPTLTLNQSLDSIPMLQEMTWRHR